MQAAQYITPLSSLPFHLDKPDQQAPQHLQFQQILRGGFARSSATTAASDISPPAMKSESSSVGDAGMTLKWKAPELGTKAASTSEGRGSHILKLRKEAFASLRFWRETRGVPGEMQRWIKAREAAAKAEAEEEAQRPKKRKKVIKFPVKPELIEFLRARQRHSFDDLSAEELAGKSEPYRREYTARKYVDAQWANYNNALIEQYDLFGHAEDEDEVTDDEDDDLVQMRSLDLR